MSLLARSNTATFDVPQTPARQVIRAELIGSDVCAASGTTVQSSTPVIAMCRTLVDAGHDPESRLEAFRGTTLCLHIRSISAGAGLEVNARGTGFIARRAVRTGPLARKTERAGQ
jgi:hypothetical protein